MAGSPEQTPRAPNMIEDKAPKPKGVIPKHTQSLVIMGVAVLMILIMWLTGGGKKAVPTGPLTPPPPPVTPTDGAKVQDFKQTIQTEQQIARRAVPAPDSSPPQAITVPGAYNYGQSSVSPNLAQGASPASPAALAPYPGYAPPAQEASAPPPPNPIEIEKRKRQYESLFASNVAVTYRKGEDAKKLKGYDPGEGPGTGQQSGQRSLVASQDPQGQALRDAEALAILGLPLQWMPPQSGPTVPSRQSGADSQTAKAESKPVNPDIAQPGAFNFASGKKYVLFEGTIIPTTLVSRMDGSFSGPVNCLVTNDVYSHDREHVLIPAGTKVLGEAEKVNAFGQERLAVFFHRLVMPDGYSVNLDRFKGLDQVGATALRDKVNNHYARIFGASLAVGVLGGIAQVGTGNVFTDSTIERARIGFGESMAMTGERILDRFLNVLPTITIREGTRIKVYLSNDLLLPDYNQHNIQSDL